MDAGSYASPISTMSLGCARGRTLCVSGRGAAHSENLLKLARRAPLHAFVRRRPMSQRLGYDCLALIKPVNTRTSPSGESLHHSLQKALLWLWRWRWVAVVFS